MENTIEVRWFVEGIPPATVQNWFKFECPGKLLTEEPVIREDLYAYQTWAGVRKLRLLKPDISKMEEINLKLREGNLELKLRQQKLGTEQFSNSNKSARWEGNIEHWCKWTEEDLGQKYFLTDALISDNPSIPVLKQRRQRIDHSVKSELTWLTIDNEHWWSVAFEMVADGNQKQQVNSFKQAVDRANKDYYGPPLSLENSYGYGHWLKNSVNLIGSRHSRELSFSKK